MNRILLGFLLLLSVPAAAMDFEEFFRSGDAFFKAHVENGAIDYAQVKAAPENLNALTDFISSASLSGQSADVQKAFYLNAYNLLVVKGIIAAYPVGSPMDISGFFDKKQYLVAGEKVTLNDIENEKIRPVYQDARIHFALVCAAKGCPKIPDYAFTPEKLDEQLDARTKKALNDPYFIRPQKKEVQVSEIFKWYRVDFADTDKGVIEFINQYRQEKLDPRAKLGYYTYDWKLNDV